MLGVDWFESAGADVEDDIGALHSLCLQPLEQRRCEVQPGGWRRDRSTLFCIDGLISLGVARLVSARDVRRERDMTVLLDRIFYRNLRVQLHHAGPALRHRQNLGLEILGEFYDASRLELAAGVHHRLPQVLAE